MAIFYFQFEISEQMSENGHISAKWIFVTVLFYQQFHTTTEKTYHSRCSIPDPVHINDHGAPKFPATFP